MYKLQIVLVPPSARDVMVSNNFRMGSMDGSQMMPGQNPSQANMQQPNTESQGQFQNNNMGNETSMMNFNSTFMTQLYQAPVNSKKFLHFTKPLNTLFDLSEEVQKKCQKMYPNLAEPIEILSIQDSTGCDLDPDFVVKDVFNMDNIVRVILKDEFEIDETANTSIYRSSKRRKLNDSTQQPASSGAAETQILPQQQPNSILKIAKKRSTTSTIKGSVNNNLRISTPLANQIYPSRMSNNSDDEGEDDVANGSFLPPPNQPQSPPIRISSGIDNYKRIRSAADDTVSRSEMVDPDKSKQQRIFSGTPVRTMMTPNRVMLTGQRVVSENLGGTAPGKQGLIFASTATQPNTTNLSPVYSPRITSGSLTIPEPRISEVEKELREGPASPASVLPAKSSRNPMKKPYLEKSISPDSDSTADTEDPQDSMSFINEKSSSKDSPFNQTSSQSEINVASKAKSDIAPVRSLANTKSSPVATTGVKRKSSLESKLQNKSFTTFSQNGREEEFRRMDHFSDEDEEDEENTVNNRSIRDLSQRLPTQEKKGNSRNVQADETDGAVGNDTVQHIDLAREHTNGNLEKNGNPSISKQKLMHMMENEGMSMMSTLENGNQVFEKPDLNQSSDRNNGSDSVIIDRFDQTPSSTQPLTSVQRSLASPSHASNGILAGIQPPYVNVTSKVGNTVNKPPSHTISLSSIQQNIADTATRYPSYPELLKASKHDSDARQLVDLYGIFLQNSKHAIRNSASYISSIGIPSDPASKNNVSDDMYSIFVAEQKKAAGQPTKTVETTGRISEMQTKPITKSTSKISTRSTVSSKPMETNVEENESSTSRSPDAENNREVLHQNVVPIIEPRITRSAASNKKVSQLPANAGELINSLSDEIPIIRGAKSRSPWNAVGKTKQTPATDERKKESSKEDFSVAPTAHHSDKSIGSEKDTPEVPPRNAIEPSTEASEAPIVAPTITVNSSSKPVETSESPKMTPPTKKADATEKKSALERLESFERSRALKKHTPIQSQQPIRTDDVDNNDTGSSSTEDLPSNEASVSEKTSTNGNKQSEVEETSNTSTVEIPSKNKDTSNTSSILKNAPAVLSSSSGSTGNKKSIVAEVQKLAKQKSDSLDKGEASTTTKEQVKPKNISDIRKMTKEDQPNTLNVSRTSSDKKKDGVSVIVSSDEQSSDSDIGNNTRSSKIVSINASRDPKNVEKERNLVKKLLGKPAGKKIDLAELRKTEQQGSPSDVSQGTTKPNTVKRDEPKANPRQNPKVAIPKISEDTPPPNSESPEPESTNGVSSDTSDEEFYSSDSSYISSSDESSDSDSDNDSDGENRVLRLKTPRGKPKPANAKDESATSTKPTLTEKSKKRNNLDSESVSHVAKKSKVITEVPNSKKLGSNITAKKGPNSLTENKSIDAAKGNAILKDDIIPSAPKNAKKPTSKLGDEKNLDASSPSKKTGESTPIEEKVTNEKSTTPLIKPTPVEKKKTAVKSGATKEDSIQDNKKETNAKHAAPSKSASDQTTDIQAKQKEKAQKPEVTPTKVITTDKKQSAVNPAVIQKEKSTTDKRETDSKSKITAKKTDEAAIETTVKDNSAVKKSDDAKQISRPTEKSAATPVSKTTPTNDATKLSTNKIPLVTRKPSVSQKISAPSSPAIINKSSVRSVPKLSSSDNDSSSDSGSGSESASESESGSESGSTSSTDDKPEDGSNGSASSGESSSSSDSGSSSSNESSSDDSSDEETSNPRKSRRKIVAAPKGKVNSRVSSQRNSTVILSQGNDMVTSTQRETTPLKETTSSKTPATPNAVTKSAAKNDSPVAELPKKIHPSLISLSDLASRGIPDVRDKRKANGPVSAANNKKAVATKNNIESDSSSSSESESSSESDTDSGSSSDSDSSSGSSSDSDSDAAPTTKAKPKAAAKKKAVSDSDSSDSDSSSDSSDSSSSDSDDDTFISARSASAALGKKKKKASGGFASLLKDSKKK